MGAFIIRFYVVFLTRFSPSVLLKDSPDRTGGQKLLCISGIEDCKKIVRRPSHLVRRLLTLRKGEATDQVSLAKSMMRQLLSQV